MQRIASVLIAAAVLSACHDRGEITGPGDGPEIPGPRFSVVVFGVTDLGSPIPGERTFGAAINAAGQVVVNAGSGPGDGFLWTNGSLVNLGGGPATDLNDQGQVVLSSPARLWENGSGFPLDPGRPRGINGNEEIVGTRGEVTDTVPVHWANRAAPAEFLQTTGLMGSLGSAQAIKSTGEIVGSFGMPPAGSEFGNSRPIFWLNAGADPEILPMAGAVGGEARDINETGEIVGTLELAGTALTAAVWPDEDSPPTLLDGPGGVSSIGKAINNLGQVVGTGVGVPNVGTIAVLWMAGEVYELGLPPGLSQGQAIDINDFGQVTGFGREIETAIAHALLWTVPILAEVDVDPASGSNTIKLDGKGRVTVAILTSPYFNAANVDPASLTLGNDDGNETPIARKRKLTPAAILKDADADGDRDLVAEFEESQLMARGDLTPATTELTLLGRLRDGKHLRGTGLVEVAP